MSLRRALIGGAVLIILATILLYVGCRTDKTPPPPSGQQQVTQTTQPPATAAAQDESWFPWKVPICFLLGIIGIIAATIFRATPGGTWRQAIPEPWAFAVFLGIPLGLWLIWVISPTIYAGVANDRFFWPIVFAAVLAAFLASQPGRVSRIASTTLGVLVVVAIVVGIVWAASSAVTPTPITTQASEQGTAPPIPAGVTRVEDDCPRPSFAGAGTYRVVAQPGKWSEKYCMPAGFYTHQEAVRDTGRFKTTTNTGEYSFSPEKSDKVKGTTAWVMVMAAGTEPEEINIKIYDLPTPPPVK